MNTIKKLISKLINGKGNSNSIVNETNISHNTNIPIIVYYDRRTVGELFSNGRIVLMDGRKAYSITHLLELLEVSVSKETSDLISFNDRSYKELKKMIHRKIQGEDRLKYIYTIVYKSIYP